jgi:hypothetical protein
MRRDISVIEEFKKHWIPAIVIICVAVAGTTWAVAIQVLVAPRDYTIDQLRHEIQNLKAAPIPAQPSPGSSDATVLQETGVFEGSAVTATDGRCNIRIVKISGDSVSLSVRIDDRDPEMYWNRAPGQRITVDAGSDSYYVDIHRTRGDIVDLAVYRHRKGA